MWSSETLFLWVSAIISKLLTLKDALKVYFTFINNSLAEECNSKAVFSKPNEFFCLYWPLLIANRT